MRSHDLARRLLEGADAPIVFEAAHTLTEGAVVSDVIDISTNLDGEICFEIGDIDSPAYDGPATPADVQV